MHVRVVQVVTKHGFELKSGGYYKHGEIVTVSYVGNYGRSLGGYRERCMGPRLLSNMELLGQPHGMRSRSLGRISVHAYAG